MPSTTEIHTVADVSAIAALFADPTRARIVAALADGRALAASVLAAESGVTASTTSEHLARLVQSGVLIVERSGRNRFYQLADDRVAAALEALAALAPQQPVRSLRESTRAGALRRARTCYDHLAGRAGVAITEALLHRGALERTGAIPLPAATARADSDPLSAPMPVHPYRLGPRAPQVFGALGVDVTELSRVSRPGRRPLLRFCVDWSEQRHHLAGSLGAALLEEMQSAGWVRRQTSGRAVQITDAGRSALRATLGVEI